MKKCVFLLLLVFYSCTFLTAQQYPFQNIKLSDDKRLDNLISLLTPEEKINCLSTRPSVPRLGIKGTHISEGLHGLALSGPANWAVKGKGASATTTFPQAIGLAQTWDPALLSQVASLEADEARFLAQNPKYESAGLIILAPNADLGRDIRWGRTEECYGEDAFLGGTMTVAYVKGLQGNHPRYWKTASLMKHFLANSNENNRMINSSDFDEQLFREYYSYPFYKGITTGNARAFMTAYNKYNDTPCVVNSVLKNVVINQWHQDGIIATDGGAFQLLVRGQHFYPDLATAAAGCIKAGVTMFLDNYKPSVKEALDKGLLTEKDIDASIRGTLRVLLKLGLLDNDNSNPYSSIGINDTTEIWTKPETKALVRKVTAESVVLLKNEGNLLPLQKEKIKSIAVIGPVADKVISDWYSGTPPYAVSVLEGIRNELGDNVTINFTSSNKADSAIIAAKASDVAIVCVGNHPLSYGLGWGQNYVASDGREDVDRQAISLEQEDLVKLVYKANPKTILVLVSSFPYSINWSKEHIPSILHITQSSQELGNGLADILFGKANPAGRLVQTWPVSIDQLPAMLDYNIRHGHTYMFSKDKALFAFGHGLSYTKFAYTSLTQNKKQLHAGDSLTIQFDLANVGEQDGDEVVQLYVRFPGSKALRPLKALKAFKRVPTVKHTTVKVSLTLYADDLRYWDMDKHAYVMEPGTVHYFIGGASDQELLEGNVEVK